MLFCLKLVWDQRLSASSDRAFKSPASALSNLLGTFAMTAAVVARSTESSFTRLIDSSL